MPRSIKYQKLLIEELQDHDEALAYLKAAFEESINGDRESLYLLLMAVKNVGEALEKKLKKVKRNPPKK